MGRAKRRLRYWWRHSERQQLLQEEMQFHIDATASELMEEGMPEQEARDTARRRFGNPTLQAEDARATWISRWISDALQDLRYTFRTLRRDAGFATFAILIVALGIGASSTIFSVVNALLLRPLPFPEAKKLVWIGNIGDDGVAEWSIQVGHFLEMREQSKSFADIAAYNTYFGTGGAKLTGLGEPERLTDVGVSQNFFAFLGVQPLLGRTFNDEECKWNGPQAVLLSYSLWKRRYNSDPEIVGRKLTRNDQLVTVVGVLPEWFNFGDVFAPGQRVDLFSAFPLTPETNRWGNTLGVIGRLKPGATVESARAEMGPLAKDIESRHQNWNSLRPKLNPLEQHVSGRIRTAVIVLACAVGVVMLIVCANLSNLLLARTATRQKEMAVRAALGAGRQRLVRQLLTESVVLACGGGTLGIALAVAGTRMLSRLEVFSSIALLQSVRMDVPALAFTLLAALVTGVLFGLLPAMRVPALALHDSLKEGGRGSNEGRRHTWVRSVLVVSEIAFACVLLVGAGLLMRSLLHVLDVDLGFQPSSAAALRIDPGARYSTEALRNSYYDEVLRQVKAIPGITGVGLTDVLPLGGDRSWAVIGLGQVWPPGRYPEGFVRVISEGYLQAIGIPLKAGRDFDARDVAAGERVAIVNETLARTLWPGENPIGKMVLAEGPFNLNRVRRVVGVVGDVRHRALEQSAGCEMYFPIRQAGYAEVDLVVRTSMPPSAMASAVRGVLRPIDPTLPINEFRTMQGLVDKAVSPRRFVVYLLAGFAGFALVLASLGIYAVISYSVTQRTQELGIRMALGASTTELQMGILMHTLRLTAIGAGIGLAASWGLSRTLRGLLFGVTSTDPVTFVAMLLVLIAVAAMAGYLPARRASRIDPMVALRAN